MDKRIRNGKKTSKINRQNDMKMENKQKLNSIEKRTNYS